MSCLTELETTQLFIVAAYYKELVDEILAVIQKFDEDEIDAETALDWIKQTFVEGAPTDKLNFVFRMLKTAFEKPGHLFQQNFEDRSIM